MNFIAIAQAGFEAWAAKPHNAKWFRKIDGTPIPNDLPVCIAQAFSDALAARSAPEAGKAVTDAATALVNFAWSAVVTDCTEAAEYLNELVGNLRAALASYPAPTGAEPVAWQWRFKGPMYSWNEGRVPENPYATFGSSWSGRALEIEERPLYASPQPVAPTGEIAGLVERLKAAETLLVSDYAYKHAGACRDAAAALTSLSAERDEARSIVRDIHWMAVRYADNRKSYAVGMCNDALRKAYNAGWLKYTGGNDKLDPQYARDGLFDQEWVSALDAANARATASEAEATSLRRKLEEVERELKKGAAHE